MVWVRMASIGLYLITWTQVGRTVWEELGVVGEVVSLGMDFSVSNV